MLATLVDKPFTDRRWVFEIKWDGYRTIAFVKHGTVRLLSRNAQNFTETFAPVTAALEHLDHDVVIDGEIVALDEKGRSRFQLLQMWRKTGNGTLTYCVFDLLWLDGHRLDTLSLIDRKKLLKAILPKHPTIMYSGHVVTRGEDFFKTAMANGLEGIMAKRKDSGYRPGIRSTDWLKIKTHARQEVVIAGYTLGRGSRKHFGALVLGVYEGDTLIYVGHTGTGFDEETLDDVWTRLHRLERKTSPFDDVPPTNAPVRWVRPTLVAEVRFQEWTDDGIMRQPVFLGLRSDKSAHDVRRERPPST